MKSSLSAIGAALRRRGLPSAAWEVLIAAAVIALCGWLGARLGWRGLPRMSTATALWPFYLDAWTRQVVWTGRLIVPIAAFLCARPLWRRFCAPLDGEASQAEGRGDVGTLCALVALAYLFHLGSGMVRFGIGDGLVHTMGRWQDYFRDVPCVTSGFLATFPEGCGLSMHAAAHPPGIIILLALVKWLGFVKPDDATLLCGAMAALAALPLYGAARRFSDEATARMSAALYLYASSITCFAVMSLDMTILLFATVALYGVSIALHDEKRAWLGGLIWGIGLFAASMCSFLVGMLALSYVALLIPRLNRGALSRARWLALLLGPLSFVAAYAILITWTGYRPLHVLEKNLIALSMSSDGERSPRLIYLGSPVAFLGSLGLPLCGLFARAFGASLVRMVKRRNEDLDSVALVVAAALPAMMSIALGKPRGEAERVYLPFVPLLVIASATVARRFYLRGSAWLLDVALPLAALQALLTEVYFDTFW